MEFINKSLLISYSTNGRFSESADDSLSATLPALSK